MADEAPVNVLYGYVSKHKFAVPVIVIVIALAGWYLLSPAESTRYSFVTTTIDRGLVEQSVSATGAVQALKTVDLSSQLFGQISEVVIDFNSKVKAGDLLALLDKKTFAAKLKSAEANLRMSKAGVEVQAAAIKKNEALVHKAKGDFARQKSLSDKGATSQALRQKSATRAWLQRSTTRRQLIAVVGLACGSTNQSYLNLSDRIWFAGTPKLDECVVDRLHHGTRTEDPPSMATGLRPSHKEMPQIQFSTEQIDKIVKYFRSIADMN